MMKLHTFQCRLNENTYIADGSKSNLNFLPSPQDQHTIWNNCQTNEIISEDMEVAETLNNFFKNAVHSLSISENVDLLIPTENTLNTVDKAITKYESHPSILNIK